MILSYNIAWYQKNLREIPPRYGIWHTAQRRKGTHKTRPEGTSWKTFDGSRSDCDIIVTAIAVYLTLQVAIIDPQGEYLRALTCPSFRVSSLKTYKFPIVKEVNHGPKQIVYKVICHWGYLIRVVLMPLAVLQGRFEGQSWPFKWLYEVGNEKNLVILEENSVRLLMRQNACRKLPGWGHQYFYERAKQRHIDIVGLCQWVSYLSFILLTGSYLLYIFSWLSSMSL